MTNIESSIKRGKQFCPIKSSDTISSSGKNVRSNSNKNGAPTVQPLAVKPTHEKLDELWNSRLSRSGHYKLEHVWYRIWTRGCDRITIWTILVPFLIFPPSPFSLSVPLWLLGKLHDRPVANIGRLGCNKPSGITQILSLPHSPVIEAILYDMACLCIRNAYSIR